MKKKNKSFLLGIFLVAVAYYFCFVASISDAMDKLGITYGSAIGAGYIFAGLGIMGMFLIFKRLNN